jgi:hypothetical protein
LLRIGNIHRDIGKRIWFQLTRDAIYTVVIQDRAIDELFFQLAVRPANHFSGSRGELEVECGSAACTRGDPVSRKPQPVTDRFYSEILGSRSRVEAASGELRLRRRLRCWLTRFAAAGINMRE